MATIDSKRIIDELIASNGKDVQPLDEGERPDPDVALIVEYQTPEGRTTWGVTWVNESEPAQARYLLESEFIRNPRPIWSKTGWPQKP